MRKRRKKVVVLGKGELAIRVAEWFNKNAFYQLSAIVPVIPEPEWTDSFMAWAKKNNVPVIESGSYRELLDETKKKEIDLAISVFYDKIIKSDFIDHCKRVINIHSAPLPRYRGVSPINWALKNKEIKHGVTIHEITPGIDDGPIISQLEYSIYPEFDEVRDVYLRSLEYAWVLFTQTMPILDNITPRVQIESMALYYSAKQNELLGDRRYFTRKESNKRQR